MENIALVPTENLEIAEMGLHVYANGISRLMVVCPDKGMASPMLKEPEGSFACFACERRVR